MKAKFFILTFFLLFFGTLDSFATYSRSGTAVIVEEREHYIRYRCNVNTQSICWTRYDDGTIKIFTSSVITIDSPTAEIFVNGQPFDPTEEENYTDIFEIYF